MSSISSNSSRGIVSSNSSSQNPAQVAPVRERYRTCCDCCHIKTGTVFLGILEAAILVGLLYGIAQQLVWKSATYTRGGCNSNILRDCLLLDFSHFSLTLIFDYIIALLLVVVLFSILLMFCGIFSDTSCLLFPHLFVQGIFLLFSVGYFVLYAWSYFYGDLYTHKRSFEMQSFIERMWLASVLLILASFQVYLFFAVLKCSLYLAKEDHSRRERETAFERLSERVRLAKENGLWRQSGVGGFMSYTRQEEDEKRKREKREKGLIGHVQWSNENKVVVLDEEASRSEAVPPPFYQPSSVQFDRPTVQFVQHSQQLQHKPTAAVYAMPRVTEFVAAESRRRSSEMSETKESSPPKNRTPSMISQPASPLSKLHHTSSQKDRERHAHLQAVKRSDSSHPQPLQQKISLDRVSRLKGDSPVKISLDDESLFPATPPMAIRRKSSREEKLKEASHAAIISEKARREREREFKEPKDTEKARTSSSSSPEKELRDRLSSKTKSPKRSSDKERPHAHHHHHHSHPSTSQEGEERTESGLTEDSAEGRRKGSRALRKLRSVESGEYDVPEEVFERRMKSRRRSSDAGRAAGAALTERSGHRHHKKERERDSGNPPSPSERKPHDPSVIVKKISITATGSPFA